MNHTKQEQTILVVDDTPENLDVLKGILKPQFKVIAVINGPLALKLAQAHLPSLILLDIMMPGMDGYDVCRALKSNPVTAKIPVIFVTAMSNISDEKKGFDIGAVDYITKPIQPAIVQARVETHLALADQQRACEKLVFQRTKELDASQRAAIFMLGESGHFNDTDTGVHIWRMAAYCGALAQAAGWSTEKVAQIELAAPMHDMGKIGISDTILKAPRKLTQEEFEVIKKHNIIGYEILTKSQTPLFKMAAEVALYHHEKWDGSGYPSGLKGEDIPASGRILAIADVFDALTMKRPYKEPWPIEKAFEAIQQDAGTHFDPRLAELFISIKEKIADIKAKWDSED
jgi:putative two-component system response regulator